MNRMKLISRLEEIFVSVLLVVLVLFTFVNVLLRYVFQYSISGSVEFSILLFAWIIFVGTSMAVKSGSHIKINLIESFLSEKSKQITTMAISLLILMISLYMSIHGFIYSYKVVGETLGSTNIPKVFVYLSFPVGFILSSVHLLHYFIIIFSGKGEES